MEPFDISTISFTALKCVWMKGENIHEMVIEHLRMPLKRFLTTELITSIDKFAVHTSQKVTM